MIRTVEPSDVADVMRRAETPPSLQQVRRTLTTVVTSDPVDPEKLGELLKTGGVVETVRTVTLKTEDSALQPMTHEEVVRRMNQVASTLPNEMFDFGDKLPDSSSTTMRTESESDVRTTTDVVQTFTTVERVTMEAPETQRTERVVRTVVSSGGGGGGSYVDTESALKSLQERLTRSEIGETASWTADDHQWETMTQCSQDTSPGSGNGGADVFANNNNHNNKNGSSARHDMHSDTDSDGSPQPRRRSPSKRRTLGSSSGSDVALHEGAELSPLEDDQGTALSQLNLLSKRCTYPTPNLFSDFDYFGNEPKRERKYFNVYTYIVWVTIKLLSFDPSYLSARISLSASCMIIRKHMFDPSTGGINWVVGLD